jgi:hypothetical protein
MMTSKGIDFDRKGLKADSPAVGDPIEAALKALPTAGKGA